MFAVWVVYDYIDLQPVARAIFKSAQEAEEEVIETETGDYCLWKFGDDLITAIQEWMYTHGTTRPIIA
jgi:hypothetical protein